MKNNTIKLINELEKHYTKQDWIQFFSDFNYLEEETYLPLEKYTNMDNSAVKTNFPSLLLMNGKKELCLTLLEVLEKEKRFEYVSSIPHTRESFSGVIIRTGNHEILKWISDKLPNFIRNYTDCYHDFAVGPMYNHEKKSLDVLSKETVEKTWDVFVELVGRQHKNGLYFPKKDKDLNLDDYQYGKKLLAEHLKEEDDEDNENTIVPERYSKLVDRAFGNSNLLFAEKLMKDFNLPYQSKYFLSSISEMDVDALAAYQSEFIKLNKKNKVPLWQFLHSAFSYAEHKIPRDFHEEIKNQTPYALRKLTKMNGMIDIFKDNGWFPTNNDTVNFKSKKYEHKGLAFIMDARRLDVLKDYNDELVYNQFLDIHHHIHKDDEKEVRKILGEKIEALMSKNVIAIKTPSETENLIKTFILGGKLSLVSQFNPVLGFEDYKRLSLFTSPKELTVLNDLFVDFGASQALRALKGMVGSEPKTGLQKLDKEGFELKQKLLGRIVHRIENEEGFISKMVAIIDKLPKEEKAQWEEELLNIQTKQKSLDSNKNKKML